MSLTPITLQDFASRRWMPHAYFTFAQGRGLVELTASELPRAACCLPIGFLPQAEGGYLPVALFGIDPARNLFVARDGSWLGGYVPARLQAAPFALAQTETGETILCVDDSLVAADGDMGLPFFTSDGQPSAALIQARDFLGAISDNRVVTLAACTALHNAGLLQPWDILIPTLQGNQRLEGLFCIDETKLNQIDAATLQSLRDCGALGMAYCQLIAMQHTAKLGELAEAHARLDVAQQPLQATRELDIDFLSKGETLVLGNF